MTPEYLIFRNDILSCIKKRKKEVQHNNARVNVIRDDVLICYVEGNNHRA